MITIAGGLAIANLGAATIKPHPLTHQLQNQPSFIHSRDIKDIDAAPCEILSEVYQASQPTPGQVQFVTVPPSVGISCLKSVPVDKERDLALIDYLLPLVSFQSTLETLANPPEEYLFPGVDVLEGINLLKTKLENDEYDSQFKVMLDLQDIFSAANDNHFDYTPALLSTMQWVRRGLNFTSVSYDGISLPLIFMSSDLDRGNHGELDYHPSAVESIDYVPVFQWLENDAIHNTANFQDPDAQFNNLFSNIPRKAAEMTPSVFLKSIEIPDNHTIYFYNGSSVVVENEIVFFATSNFTNIKTGEDVHNAFEIPPTAISTAETAPSTSPTNGPNKSEEEEVSNSPLPGYPYPVTKNSQNNIAGYFLNETDFEDTTVLSILSFVPVGFDVASGAELNMTEFVLEGERVVVELFKRAKREKRDKLIIDLSANGGGSVTLAQALYRLLFPDGEFSGYDRYRANDALKAASEADYEALAKSLITQSPDLPIDPRGHPIKAGKEWFGPYLAKGDANVTTAYQVDLKKPFDADVGAYLNGFNPDKDMNPIKTEPFKPENIIIVTDGTCASACGIFTGLLTRNHGIRTLALGGRPLNFAMQAMGGVKGTLLLMSSDLTQAFESVIEEVKENKTALSTLNDAHGMLPVFQDAPLLPLLNVPGGGRVNALNGYTKDDLEGYPVHFRYEAAHCRLFYTQQMLKDVTETWRRAAKVAWGDDKCVPGSTSSPDGTIGSEPLGYDQRVRSQALPLENLGALSSKRRVQWVRY